jgi:hypothetical protein
MTTKKVEITFATCDNCPYYYSKGFLRITHICGNPSHEVEKIIAHTTMLDMDRIDIPKWCKLEDVL